MKWSKIVEKLTGKVAKAVYSIIIVVLVFMLGSWMTNQTLRQNLDGYKNYTISQVIGNELNKDGGVNDQLAEIKTIVISIQEKQDKKDDADYKTWITDINKYYSWCDGKNDARLSTGFLEKMSIYWCSLPDSYKTDILKSHYDYAFAYIQKVCK